MTTHTNSPLPVASILAAAKDFFLGPDRMADAWIESESESHIAFCTFRGNLSVAASADPEDGSRSRVRVSTLREEGLVPRLMTFLASQEAVATGG
ncbi:MAG: hypothetical protein OEU54_12330 [Gemmatimonadota bacterium]|nr:hypothetical protein [Gemmatimonadota bacterium]